MNIKFILQIIQILVSVLIICLVLIQSRGAGISSAISGFGGFYRTKRGMEKVIFIVTIILGIGFILNSATLVMLR